MSIEKLQALAERAQTEFKEAILETRLQYGELTLTVERERIIDILSKLKREPYRFHQLIDLTGVDYPKRERRFDVVLLRTTAGPDPGIELIQNAFEVPDGHLFG